MRTKHKHRGFFLISKNNFFLSCTFLTFSRQLQYCPFAGQNDSLMKYEVRSIFSLRHLIIYLLKLQQSIPICSASEHYRSYRERVYSNRTNILSLILNFVKCHNVFLSSRSSNDSTWNSKVWQWYTRKFAN